MFNTHGQDVEIISICVELKRVIFLLRYSYYRTCVDKKTKNGEKYLDNKLYKTVDTAVKSWNLNLNFGI